MDAYAIGILPLLVLIRPEQDRQLMKHVAYADDLAGGSRLESLRQWWDRCVQYGPAIGYHPKASKSWLVVKGNQYENALRIFDGTGVNITKEGKKYLGGFVGTEDGKTKYIKVLLESWCHDLKELAKIAKIEPQAAYSSFTSGFNKHKMTYFMRTIPNIENEMAELDSIIDGDFLPAITESHNFSADERRLVSLPVRMGGLGIPIFSELCIREHYTSKNITKQLSDNIVNRNAQLMIDVNKQKEIESKMRSERNAQHKATLDDLRSRMTREQSRANDLAQLKGASAWLNSLPLKDEGYSLNKREFFDALALRYRWELKRLPFKCSCSKKAAFEVDHAMNCLTGGFIHKRHDGVRDIMA